MGKWIGPLQQEILDSMDIAMTAGAKYRGSAKEPGWVYHFGLEVKLHPGIYDLRAVLDYMAEKNDRLGEGRNAERAYQVAFSNSVRALVRRGILEPLWLVPVIDWLPECEDHLLHLVDGVYIWVTEKERRFVRVPDYKVFASRSKSVLFNRSVEREKEKAI